MNRRQELHLLHQRKSARVNQQDLDRRKNRAKPNNNQVCVSLKSSGLQAKITQDKLLQSSPEGRVIKPLFSSICLEPIAIIIQQSVSFSELQNLFVQYLYLFLNRKLPKFFRRYQEQEECEAATITKQYKSFERSTNKRTKLIFFLNLFFYKTKLPTSKTEH